MESFLIDEDRGLGGDDLLVDHDGELKIISGFRVVRVLDVDGQLIEVGVGLELEVCHVLLRYCTLIKVPLLIGDYIKWDNN